MHRLGNHRLWGWGLASAILWPATLAAASQAPIDIAVLDARPDHIVLRYDIGPFTQHTIAIDGVDCASLHLGGESALRGAGEPDLPLIARSVIIDPGARMAARVIEAEYYQIGPITSCCAMTSARPRGTRS